MQMTHRKSAIRKKKPNVVPYSFLSRFLCHVIPTIIKPRRARSQTTYTLHTYITYYRRIMCAFLSSCFVAVSRTNNTLFSAPHVTLHVTHKHKHINRVVSSYSSPNTVHTQTVDLFINLVAVLFMTTYSFHVYIETHLAAG